MTRYKGWPAWEKWLDLHAELPSLIRKFLGTHPGAAPAGGRPLQSSWPRRGDLVLPNKGSGNKRGKGGGAILVPHPPFPTQRGRRLWGWDFPEQQKILGN